MKELQSLSKFLTTAILFLTLTVSSSAFAEESPTYGYIAVKGGAYYPDIDKEFDNATPFKDFFGANKLFIFELELGGYVWQGFGKLGFAFHGGYTSDTADAETSSVTASGGNASGKNTPAEASDSTSFSMFPLYLSAFYSFDYLATRFNIPIAINVDAGLVYIPWIIKGTDGKVATFNGTKGRGGSWGWRATAGLAFLLDIIDENTAALFDLSWGVNNSYIFVEFVYEQVNDFGKKNSFNLSDMYFQGGLKFEF